MRYNAIHKESAAKEADQAPPLGLKKVSFGAITKKKEDSKTAYPALPDVNGEAAKIAARIIERSEQFDALKGALETDKAELKLMATLPFFELNSGKREVPSSLSVQSPSGEVLVTFQNRYSGVDSEAVVLPILGEHTSRYFRQNFKIEIDGDKLPDTHTQDLLNELQTLFAKFNALDALNVSESIKPVAEFHAARHLILTPERNFQLNQICPIIAMVKTKGRK